MNRRIKLNGAFLGWSLALCMGLAGAADKAAPAVAPEVQAKRNQAEQALKAAKEQSNKLNAAYVKREKAQEKARKDAEKADRSQAAVPGPADAVPGNPGQGQVPVSPAAPVQGQASAAPEVAAGTGD